ncbi:MAG: hypothetical protein LBV73_05000, partial [Paraburkholderia sp.]|nr:hypothetical protein [Paraburkholderia sp.]
QHYSKICANFDDARKWSERLAAARRPGLGKTVWCTAAVRGAVRRTRLAQCPEASGVGSTALIDLFATNCQPRQTTSSSQRNGENDFHAKAF